MTYLVIALESQKAIATGNEKSQQNGEREKKTVRKIIAEKRGGKKGGSEEG